MDYQRSLEVRSKVVDIASTVNWEFYVTGTYRLENATKSIYTVKRRIFSMMNYFRDREGGKGVSYFIGIEKHRTGMLHWHGLIGRGLNATKEEIFKFMFEKYGRSTVVEYEPGKGAEHYITKYIIKNLCEWDIYLNNKDKMKGVAR
jgi:hypothetical protein